MAFSSEEQENEAKNDGTPPSTPPKTKTSSAVGGKVLSHHNNRVKPYQVRKNVNKNMESEDDENIKPVMLKPKPKPSPPRFIPAFRLKGSVGKAASYGDNRSCWSDLVGIVTRLPRNSSDGSKMVGYKQYCEEKWTHLINKYSMKSAENSNSHKNSLEAGMCEKDPDKCQKIEAEKCSYDTGKCLTEIQNFDSTVGSGLLDPTKTAVIAKTTDNAALEKQTSTGEQHIKRYNDHEHSEPHGIKREANEDDDNLEHSRKKVRIFNVSLMFCPIKLIPLTSPF